MGQDDRSPWESVIESQYIRECQCNIVPKLSLLKFGIAGVGSTHRTL